MLLRCSWNCSNIVSLSGFLVSLLLKGLRVALGFRGSAYKHLCASSMICAAHVQAKEYGGPKREVLIDVGTADPHLEKQLKPDDFREAAASNKALDVQLRKQARTRTI